MVHSELPCLNGQRKWLAIDISLTKGMKGLNVLLQYLRVRIYNSGLPSDHDEFQVTLLYCRNRA